MLLITRRLNEAIMINGQMMVKILDIKGGRVKLGFEYPQGNTVYRAEVFEKIKAENEAAMQPPVNLDNAKLGHALKVGTPHASNGQTPTTESDARATSQHPKPLNQ